MTKASVKMNSKEWSRVFRHIKTWHNCRSRTGIERVELYMRYVTDKYVSQTIPSALTNVLTTSLHILEIKLKKIQMTWQIFLTERNIYALYQLTYVEEDALSTGSTFIMIWLMYGNQLG